jgi:hypothetical protein
MAKNVRCVEPENVQKGVSRWLVTAFIGEDGTVFIAARVAGNEHRIVLSAMFDGVDCVIHRHHVYLPVDWMAENFPEGADTYRMVEARVRQKLGAQKRPPSDV